ncbi:hypothetical protein FKO59_17830 [Burkholderia pseudomallei]|nr:hypothetical protein [Burkholderia pseudomallei]QDH29220.1 hypothetical protein FKO42_17860 [Burkholderia pseudomallei]QDH39491.1 hypothetical protein FKO59_17830 [Burkholderia pseudomallei]RXS80345.1 hypothetical protein C2U63_12980 [Burkholderia pseudomallei]
MSGGASVARFGRRAPMFSYVRPRAAVRGAHASPAPRAGRRTKVDNARPRVSIESSILTYRFQ